MRNFCPRTSFTKFSRSQRALESVFCQEGTFYNVVCKKNITTNALEWVSDNQCESYPTTTTISSTTTSTFHFTKNNQSNQSSTKKKFNSDEHSWIMLIAIFLSIIVPFLLPALIYFCCCCSVSYLRVTSMVFYICKYIVVLLFLDSSRGFNFKISPKLTSNKITVGPCLNALSGLGRGQQRDEILFF